MAALQQVAEEYPEALESPETAPPRLLQLAALLDDMAALAAQLDPADAQTRAELAAVRRSVTGTDYSLGQKSRALAASIAERRHLRRTPPRKPDLLAGRRLYAQACAACHGTDLAHPATPIGEALTPPAVDLWHPQYNWTPYEMFNRVTYGGVETAMPSFAEGLSEDERWDVVFFLFAERWPPCARKLTPLPASDLALAGDFELSNRFGYAAAACLRRDFTR